MYSLDTNAAMQADVTGGRITESGEYVGKITAAWEETFDSGAKAVKINFETAQEEYAKELTMFVIGKNGSQLHGLNTVNAIMMCAEVRGMNPVPGKVELYDRGIGKVVNQDKMVFNELVGKPIGLLLQQAEKTDKDGYLVMSKDGNPFHETNIFGVFEAGTGRTATEKAKRVAQASDKDKRVEYLKKNPIRKAKNAKIKQQSGGIAPLPEYQNGAPQFGAPGYANSHGYDDSIPF